MLRYIFKVLLNIINNKSIKTLIITAFSIFIFTIIRGYLEVYNAPISYESKNIRVIDGDTIALNSINIRLLGVDAPEIKQTCNTSKKYQVNCGILAKIKMQELIGNNIVVCSSRGLDRYKRLLSYCYVKDININLELVKTGYAYAYSRSNIIFKIYEIIARISKKGLWQTDFQNPKDWRKNNTRNKYMKVLRRA